MGRTRMRYNRVRAAAWFLALGVLTLAGCANQTAPPTGRAQVSALAPGMARLWVLRQADPPGGNVFASRPMVFANGTPIGESTQGTAFFHDFPPGSHRLTVQAFG